MRRCHYRSICLELLPLLAVLPDWNLRRSRDNRDRGAREGILFHILWDIKEFGLSRLAETSRGILPYLRRALFGHKVSSLSKDPMKDDGGAGEPGEGTRFGKVVRGGGKRDDA